MYLFNCTEALNATELFMSELNATLEDCKGRDFDQQDGSGAYIVFLLIFWLLIIAVCLGGAKS